MNLLEQQEDRPYVTHCWHISVVKTHVHQNSNPQNHEHSATRKEEASNSNANEATGAHSYILNKSYDPPPYTHVKLGLWNTCL